MRKSTSGETGGDKPPKHPARRSVEGGQGNDAAGGALPQLVGCWEDPEIVTTQV